MGNRGKKTSKKQNVKKEYLKNENHNVSQDKIIEMHAEAYYRALKRIEQEKSKVQEKKKDKWFIDLLFMLNVFFWPWKINKRFRINNGIYDSLLILFVSGVLYVFGFLIWLFSMVEIILEFEQMINEGISSVSITTIFILILMLFLGSTFSLAGREFNKETDSNKIYAFSACVIALISCVVSIITLSKM